jgi:hypothetical protein
MNSLDQKLKEIVEKYENTDSIELVAQIRRAFADGGYKIPLGVTVTPKTVRLTGQEWYDRFEKEIKYKRPYTNNIATLEAAKKAAGLTNRKGE